MRHHLSGRQLSRNSAHRHALMRNMSVSLLRHETIRTTLPKAKELRRVVEPLITLAKNDGGANRRRAFARLRDAQIVEKLFASHGADAAGGRTRAGGGRGAGRGSQEEVHPAGQGQTEGEIEGRSEDCSRAPRGRACQSPEEAHTQEESRRRLRF